ncbi:hypothetical protein KNV00_gp160 [Streptomyces phage Bmoc]|uniref:Uncharacterized protein n=1 Tax=Streptomyces phage Bmoc TaxID=2725629 RepID=A0A6M3SYX9_9CAUD|nr:hypothetical protein KNV00_gp160 [Streptomyces phage Bmoc]QJD50859.1 hypothetical protein SEA_BMOC_119 [Streptomyces phage Bmoc]
MRLFELHRDIDSSGVSGTGVVAQGVEFDNRQCCMTWLTEWNSVAVYPDIQTLEAIHGHGGNTRVVWVEGPATQKYVRVAGKDRPIQRVDKLS